MKRSFSFFGTSKIPYSLWTLWAFIWQNRRNNYQSRLNWYGTFSTRLMMRDSLIGRLWIPAIMFPDFSRQKMSMKSTFKLMIISKYIVKVRAAKELISMAEGRLKTNLWTSNRMHENRITARQRHKVISNRMDLLCGRCVFTWYFETGFLPETTFRKGDTTGHCLLTIDHCFYCSLLFCF